MACVQTDCIQSNTGYYGTVVETYKGEDVFLSGKGTAEECRQLCLTTQGAVAFTLNNEGMTCTCLSEKKLKRHQEDGAFSGRTNCKNTEASLSRMEEQFEESLNETVKIPMDDVEACEKSSPVSDWKDLEEKHPDWVQSCLRKATKITTIEFNAFYQRFAKFVDMLTWKAGCGASHEVAWTVDLKG